MLMSDKRGFNPKNIVRDKGDCYTVIKASV